MPSKTGSVNTFLTTIRKNNLKYIRFMLFYIGAAVVIEISNVFVAKTQGSIGQAAAELDRQRVIGFLLVMAALTMAKVLFSAVSALVTERFTGRTQSTMRRNFAEHFTRISYGDASRKNSGEMLSLYANDLPGAASFITTDMFEQSAQIVSLIVSAVFMVLINPLLTAIFFVSFPLLIFMQAKISEPIGKHMQNVSIHRAEFNAVVSDSLQNPATVITYSLENVMEQRYLESYDKYYAVFMKYVSTLVKLVMSGLIASFLPSLIVAVMAGLYVAGDKMTVAEFIAFTTISETAGSWLTMFSQNLSRIQVDGAGAKRLLENMVEPHEDIRQTGDKPVALPQSDAPAIAFHEVSFSYTAEHEVLSNVSFAVPIGKKAAIVGASGSGKSTVMKLLLSLYEPSGGKIAVFGADADGYGKKALRDMMAYVPQDSFLLPVSILENIVGNMPVDMAKVEKACQNAGILSFVKALPDGFDAVLSESGETISGGQRQRIAMARAFYREAPIVLLDESTSALDPITEKAVLDSFYASMEGKTALVVAHRPAAIAGCDIIIMLGGGRVAGMGSHDELMRDCPEYAALYCTKKNGEEAQ